MFGISRTHYVPITRLVFAWFWPFSNDLANPKSDILGFISSSNKTLLALRSLWITLSLESSWRYKRPFAMPCIMLHLSFQSSCLFFLSSDDIYTEGIYILWTAKICVNFVSINYNNDSSLKTKDIKYHTNNIYTINVLYTPNYF